MPSETPPTPEATPSETAVAEAPRGEAVTDGPPGALAARSLAAGLRAEAPLVGLAALAALTTLLCIHAAPVPYHNDAMNYISLGEHLGRGEGYTSSLRMFPVLIQPPLYPALIALGSLAGSGVTSAVAVCALASALTVVAVDRIHRTVWPSLSSVPAAALTAVHPFVAFAGALTSEPVFLACLSWATALGLAAVVHKSARRAAGAGALLALGLLTRPEAVLTAAVLATLFTLAPSGPRLRHRAGLVAALLGGAALLVVPYGLYLRSELGFFSVLPKVRYNTQFPTLVEHMEWQPDQTPDQARDLRVAHALMPDDATFVLDYAFYHPDFDPRSMFPQRAEGGAAGLAPLLHGARVVAAYAIRHVGFLNPLALVAAAFAVARGVFGRASTPRGVGTPPLTRWLVGALVALVGAHLVPPLISGADFEARYLAPSALFSAPLVAAGAVQLFDRLRRPSQRVRTLLAAALLVAVHGPLTARLVHLILREGSRVDGPTLLAATAVCERVLPEGARVASENARCPFLRRGTYFMMPYVESTEQLQAYFAHHAIEYAIFDGDHLLKNPSRVLRGLRDRSRWPPTFRLLGEITARSGEPIYFVAVR